MKNNKKYRVGSEAQYGPRTVGEILHDFLENSNEPLAVAFRHRKAYANTELCVDLKTILTSDRRARMRKDYRGVLTRDGEEHFTFIEEAAEMKRVAVVSRNPIVYAGACINVHRRDDGSLYPTFRQPQLSTFYTFKDFCREAAEELYLVAGLVEEELKK